MPPGVAGLGVGRRGPLCGPSRAPHNSMYSARCASRLLWMPGFCASSTLHLCLQRQPLLTVHRVGPIGPLLLGQEQSPSCFASPPNLLDAQFPISYNSYSLIFGFTYVCVPRHRTTYRALRLAALCSTRPSPLCSYPTWSGRCTTRRLRVPPSSRVPPSTPTSTPVTAYLMPVVTVLRRQPATVRSMRPRQPLLERAAARNRPPLSSRALIRRACHASMTGPLSSGTSPWRSCGEGLRTSGHSPGNGSSRGALARFVFARYVDLLRLTPKTPPHVLRGVILRALATFPANVSVSIEDLSAS